MRVITWNEVTQTRRRKAENSSSSKGTMNNQNNIEGSSKQSFITRSEMNNVDFLI